VNKIILKTFITSIDSTIPQGATILYDIGETLGNQINHLFVGNELRKLLSQIGDFWQRNLLGEIDEVRFESDKEFYFNVYECFECSHMPDIGQTVCKFDEGILTNILSTKLSQPVSVKEIECFATGSDHCRFKIILLDSDQITKLKL
jgi:predicted hydrocarbon binding protein